MFLWCFGRRKRSASSIRDLSKIHPPSYTSPLELKKNMSRNPFLIDLTPSEASPLEPMIREPQDRSRNPFHLDLVIEVMLEEAKVKTLKTLRKLDRNWKKLAIKELEKRAVEDQLDPIDLSDVDLSQDQINQFFKSTSSNPQLFRSFCVNFPNSFVDAFTKYSPIVLRIEFNYMLKFTPPVTKFFVNFLRGFAPTLQVLEIVKAEDKDARIEQNLIPRIFLHATGSPIVFQKLTKLIWVMEEKCHASKDHIPFDFILNKGGTVDPTPNLTSLEASINSGFLRMVNNGPIARWTQLTSLRICKSTEDDVGFTSTLLSMGRAGMRLKVFALYHHFSPLEGSPEITRNWSKFFVFQAKSLEVLELEWYYCEDDENGYDSDDSEEMVDSKIHLPIFEELHTLHLFLHYKIPPSGPVQIRMFKGIQIPIYFPKLDHLQVNQRGLFNMFPLDGVPISLKTLYFRNNPNSDWLYWACKFPTSLESFITDVNFFREWGAKGPWKRTLKGVKILELDGVYFPLKATYLTGLEKLIVGLWDDWKIRNYLSLFEQVLTLKLTSITFKYCEMPSDEVKAKFRSHFPYPVEFQPMIVIDHYDYFPFDYVHRLNIS